MWTAERVRNRLDAAARRSGTPPRSTAADHVLLAVAVIAAGCSGVCVLQAVVRAREDEWSGNVGVLWIAVLIPWSLGLIFVAARAARLPVRSTASRTALLLCTSVPALLVVVNLVVDLPGTSRIVPDVIALARNDKAPDRLWLLLATIPLFLSWKLLVELPSIREFGFRRWVAHLALVAPLAPVVAVSLSPVADPDGLLWHLGGILTGGVLIGTAAGIVAISVAADPRLPPGLHWLVAIGVPASQLAGATLAFVVAFHGELLTDLLPAVGYLICLLPLGALGFFAYDYLIVGGSAFVPGLLRAGTDPAAIQTVLRTALGDPRLMLAFEREHDDELVDVGGHVIDVDAIAPGRLQIVSLDSTTVAAVVWSRTDNGGPARTSSVFTVAGVVLERARVHAQLQASVVELTESRRRLEYAHNAGRREVERDLHDGAQQQLLAIRIALRTAARTAAAPETRALAEQIGADVDTALRQIQDLARGIYPAPLRSGGLPSALESLTSSHGKSIAVVRSIAPFRYPEAIEEAVYFVVSEALTNVVKHSRAREANVTVGPEGDNLVATVSDRGRGGAVARSDSGLTGLADRVAAVDGKLDIRSAAGAGTTVSLVIPLHDEPRPIVPAVVDLTRLPSVQEAS